MVGQNRQNWSLLAKLVVVSGAPVAAGLFAPRYSWQIVCGAIVVIFVLPQIVRFLAGLLTPPTSEGEDVEKIDSDFERGPVEEFPWGPTRPAQLGQTLVLAVGQVWLLAAIAFGTYNWGSGTFWSPVALTLFFVVLSVGLMAPVAGFGIAAVRAGKLPPKSGDKPQHHHITGFGALFLVATIVGIIILAAIATIDQNINQQIHAQWGAGIVYVLVAFFLMVATVPSFGVPRWITGAVAAVGKFLRPFGRLLSAIDSALVYAVAPAVGVALRRRWLGRYAYLVAYFIPLGVMGFYLPTPWGLAPVVWALLAAISVSRRWSWVEDDRETAMLTAQFRSENLRVGFDQDLRDEALLAFSSMFIFVPLALRQIQLWGDDVGIPVFSIKGADIHNLYYWIQYFGSELAKAVPFVDWAEIYDVEGDGPIEMHSTISRHVVFATRVLVDLVFLATLLQVLSTFSRNAKQIEMFREGAIDRFDPFMERTQFKELVAWDGNRWVAVEDQVKRFGRRRKYNLTRLLELREDKQQSRRQSGSAGEERDRRLPDWAVWAAAGFLYDRDYQDGAIVGELYDKLREESGLAKATPPNKDAVANVLDELEKSGRRREIADLSDVRSYLNGYSSAWELRRRVITLIAREGDDLEDEDRLLQVEVLAVVLSGARADTRAPNRRLAFEALKKPYLHDEQPAVRAFLRAAADDQSGTLMAEIKRFVQSNPRVLRSEPEDQRPLV